MLKQRLIVAIVIIPTSIAMVSLGGWFLAAFLALIIGYAAYEYWHMFSSGGYHPSPLILVGGTAAMIFSRMAFQFSGSAFIISLIILITMAWEIVKFEKGSHTSAMDLGITIGGVLYLGWLGAYMVSLREMTDGLFWLMTVIPAISIADAGAYFIGSRFGKHKLSRLVSPNKSWEGYLGGVIIGTLGTILLAFLWHFRAPIITVEKALIIGLVITILSPLGDLGESMLKRNFQLKDSSKLLPGHGGAFDRVDSWLWAAPIGYYIIITFWA